jgi:replicative DNA helicase
MNQTEQEELVRFAQERDTRIVPSPQEWVPWSVRGYGVEDLPGSDFNHRGSWRNLLTAHNLVTAHNWELLFHEAGLDYWRAPGETRSGCTATSGFRPGGQNLLHVYTAGAPPLEPGYSYTKFTTLALLDHNGVFPNASSWASNYDYGGFPWPCSSTFRPPPCPAMVPELHRSQSRSRAKGQAGAAGSQTPGRSPGYRFAPITSADFARGDYRLEWLVRRLLTRNQPTIVGGPRKSLKTSLLVDLAISLASATPFLNTFQVYHRMRTALLSGESGEAVLQETARRVCAARGLDLANLDVLWGLQLPQLASPQHLDALRDGLRQHGVEVAVIEPLYLCLLAGAYGQQIDPANMFEMGPLLLAVAQTCLSVGCTPILGTHSKKYQAVRGEPLELEDLAFSGIQEFCRQWLLVSRREAYQPGTGSHRLWLSAGGSAGQSGLWALDIEEGVLDENFSGRRWEVTVATTAEVREAARDARRSAQAVDDHADDAALLLALDRLAGPEGVAVFTTVRQAARLSPDRMIRAVLRLREAGLVEETEATTMTGRNLKVSRTVKGLRRASR